MILRNFNFVLLATSVAALIGVYALKYSVEETASEKAGLERTIARQEGELSLLRADWAYLNQPGHVAPIVVRHVAALGLEPVKQEQFGGFENLPMRLKPKDDTALDALFESLADGVDPIAEIIQLSEEQ
jgi:hypothetical protein